MLVSVISYVKRGFKRTLLSWDQVLDVCLYYMYKLNSFGTMFDKHNILFLWNETVYHAEIFG